MLSENKEIMQQNLNSLLNINGPFYNAAYNAMLAVIPEPVNANEIEFDDTGDMASLLNDTIKQQKDKRINDAKEFAKEFVNSLKDGEFMNVIADEVDKHIKSAYINITMLPQGLSSIVSPTGPCSGTLVINNSTANIQLL